MQIKDSNEEVVDIVAKYSQGQFAQNAFKKLSRSKTVRNLGNKARTLKINNMKIFRIILFV